MQIKEKVLLHNKFDVKVVDSRTGEVKQTATAYNVITNYYFNSRLLNSPMYKTSDLLTYIAIGTGTGTPAITDTALFTHLTRKAVTTLETVYEYPTSHITRQIKLEATECNGQTITEVGFEAYSSGTWSTYYYLMTHAMLQDSEGNQIAIVKTDVDVVYITATFYATYTPSGFGDNGVYPVPDKNYLLRWLLTGSVDSTIRFARFPIQYSSDMEIKYTSSKSYSFTNGVGSIENYQYDLPVTTFLDSECNNRIVRHFGIAGFGAFTFPNHDAFPPYAVNHLVIGEGDGETAEFNIKCPLIQAGTPRVYVNNVELVAGTDFTVDCESNCGDWYENYHTAAMTAQDDNVEFGNIRSCTPYTGSYTRYDPLAWWNCYNTAFYPSSCTVSEATPIWIDFLTAKECNRLKIDTLTITSSQIDNLVIEHSSDNETWTRVGHTRNAQVWSWPLVSARYWRVYIPGYNWTYSIYGSNNSVTARDGQSYKSTFSLGKTVPGLKLTNPPAAGETITASYSIEYPFKTANNLLRFTCSIQLQRG